MKSGGGFRGNFKAWPQGVWDGVRGGEKYGWRLSSSVQWFLIVGIFFLGGGGGGGGSAQDSDLLICLLEGKSMSVWHVSLKLLGFVCECC